jgi:hypothetical protein
MPVVQAAMPAHEPPEIGVGVEVIVVGVGVGVLPGIGVGVAVGGVAPANCTTNLVKSQAFWVTLLQVPESDPLLSGGLHSRSRLSDQYV